MCFRSFFKVSLGSIYYNLRGGQILTVSKTWIHESYFTSGGDEDIGLIQLNQPAILSLYRFSFSNLSTERKTFNS